MSYNQALSDDLKLRLSKLQQGMQQNNIEACILTSSVNLFYLTGVIYSGYMFIPSIGEPIHFVKRPQNCLMLDDIVSIRKPEQIKEELDKRGIAISQLTMLEVDFMSYSDCKRLMDSLELKSPVNASVFMRQTRSVKTGFEISQSLVSAHYHQLVYSKIPSLYRDGMTDIELQIEIEHEMRSHGSLGYFRSYGENMEIYMGSLLAGNNAEAPSAFDFALGGAGMNPILPLGANGTKLEEGTTIMVDMAANYTPWMVDMTRVYSVGKTTELAYKAHQVSIDINNMVLDCSKPGVKCADLYDKAMEMVVTANLEPYFMGTKQQAKFIGHGLGLEINEPPVLTPRSKEMLEEDVLFALEPKFVIPEVGAVGIENTYRVTNDGIEKLTIFEENIIEL